MFKYSNIAIGRSCHALMAAMLIAVFSSCVKEDTPTLSDEGENIRFEIQSNNWNRIKGKSSVRALYGPSIKDTLFLHISSTDEADAKTKANPVSTETFYNSIGISAYRYQGDWSEELTPDYIYNEELLKENDWTSSQKWPGRGYNVRFFSYAPYGCDGLTISEKGYYGSPLLTYEVPDNAQDQIDILAADTGELPGNGGSTAELEFSHIMTALRIVTAADILPGKITKISLKGVYGAGTYSYATRTWTTSAKKDFTQTLDISVDGTENQPLMDDSYTLMMIPQTLPQGAALDIEFTDQATSTTHYLTASIAGIEWPAGNTVTFKISTGSLSIEPTLQVSMPEFSHKGGLSTFYVTSYTTVTSGAGTKTVATPWTAEFVEEDGNGGYKAVEKPHWITYLTLKGEGSTNSEPFSITVKPQELTYETPHDDALRQTEPVQGIFDLSTNGGIEPMSTSNCYIVNAPGTYSFPLVYGNAIKDGVTNSSAYTTSIAGLTENFVNHRNAYITDPYIYNNTNCVPDNATLIWQDAKNLVNGIRLDDAKQNLIFTIDKETIKEGNAVIALKNASDEIMWSWHIWVTDMKAGAGFTTVPDGDNQYQVLNRNVGECYLPVEIYPERRALLRVCQATTSTTQIIEITTAGQRTEWASSPVYQWGYKNPVIGWSGKMGELTNKTWYDAEGNERTDLVMGSNRSIQNMIKNPGAFFGSYSNMSHTRCNLWNNDLTYDSTESISGSYEIKGKHKKTIYDPCPRGCAVLPYFIVELIGAYPFENRVSTEYREIYDINGHSLSMSIPGTRDTYTGELNLGSWSKCWTSLHRVSIGHRNGSCDAYGRGIRPFKEL